MLCFAIFRVNLTSKSRFPACACLASLYFKAIAGGCGALWVKSPTENERIERHLTEAVAKKIPPSEYRSSTHRVIPYHPSLNSTFVHTCSGLKNCNRVLISNVRNQSRCGPGRSRRRRSIKNLWNRSDWAKFPRLHDRPLLISREWRCLTLHNTDHSKLCDFPWHKTATEEVYKVRDRYYGSTVSYYGNVKDDTSLNTLLSC